MPTNPPKIAIVHDELIRRGGAEIVLEELLTMYPQADVYALYAGNVPKMTINGKTYDIKTSSIQKMPLWFRKHPGRLLPFLPQAAEQFDLSSYDLVISSSSGFAKGVVTRSGVPHLCYCHTPTRYLWDSYQAVLSNRHGKNILFRLLSHYLRMVDFTIAQRPDAYIANSEYTKSRITTYYRKDSVVVYPPIDTNFFLPGNAQNLKREYFLCVGRLTKEKRFDHAIHVAEKLGLHLKIVGVGSDEVRLKNIAGKYTEFLGKVSKEELRDLYRSARALIQPGIEDFGMAAVEALACGTPIIAYGKGGILEIVTNGVHGILYQDQLPETLAEAIRQFLRIERAFYPGNLQKRAMKFGRAAFQKGISEQVEHLFRLRNTSNYTL
ncbi:MAG TPA: glycosyltransferase [Candidatus Andersenbacteria bacterium]|nr:glycosyltransferase [Candidatus Andersenbacteria bacterium]